MSEKDELEAYFRAQTNIRLSSIEKKIDRLIGFEKMVLGGSLAISAIISVAIAILFGR